MKINEFEKELQELDSDLSVLPNKPHAVFPQLENLASVRYKGEPLFTIPNYEIFDETNPNYGIEGLDGRFISHRNRLDALSMVKSQLERLKTDNDYKEAFFGEGEYSEAELRKVEPTVEVVEDLEVEVREVKG